MKTIFIGTCKAWGITCHGESKQEVMDQIGCEWDELTFEEVPEDQYLLRQIPEEFRSAISYMAYERGHSAGEEEVMLHLRELVFDLAPAIQKFEQRLKGETP